MPSLPQFLHKATRLNEQADRLDDKTIRHVLRTLEASRRELVGVLSQLGDNLQLSNLKQIEGLVLSVVDAGF